jgi:hydroxypyruvate isomerase
MTRREFLPTVALAGIALNGAPTQGDSSAHDPSVPPAFRAKPNFGRLKQSVCGSVFGKGMSFDDQCRLAAELGFQGFDLQAPERWPTLKKYGLISTMSFGGGGTIKDGLNRKENHSSIEKSMRPLIDQCAEAGSPNLITFSGNRGGMSDEEGLENCALFLNKIKQQAEDKNVNICMELLNSRVDHPDYMCDHTLWGVELCKRVNSPRVKLLFDIYHMQIMDGDIVRHISRNMQWMGHFHTGGVPGRHEIDNRSNELNYNFVAKAIADAGYQGFCAHEYSPAAGRDFLSSLKEAREIFTV